MTERCQWLSVSSSLPNVFMTSWCDQWAQMVEFYLICYQWTGFSYHNLIQILLTSYCWKRLMQLDDILICYQWTGFSFIWFYQWTQFSSNWRYLRPGFCPLWYAISVLGSVLFDMLSEASMVKFYFICYQWTGFSSIWCAISGLGSDLFDMLSANSLSVLSVDSLVQFYLMLSVNSVVLSSIWC